MTIPPEVADYLAAVRDTLGDIPAAERDDLLAEVEASLVEAASEGGSITARLGPPDEFAAELRSAAGLNDVALPAGPGVLDRLRSAAARIGGDSRVVALRPLLRELAPIWWLVRAYVAVVALALWADWSWTTLHPSIPSFGIGGPGSGVGGVVVIALAAVASVALGLLARRRRGALRRVSLGVNVVLALAMLPVLDHLTDTRPREAFTPQAVTVFPTGLAYDGAPVENIYPYTRDGRLLLDVLLYDGAGRPIEIGAGVTDPDRRLLRTEDGTPIFNSFPLRYYEPGTADVANPTAAPPVELPQVATPALDE
jgi:uncharacterized membrane protein